MKLLEGIPEILFKYRDWEKENHRNIIFKKEIYFPSMSQFNDPYEGQVPYRYNPEELTPDRIFIKMFTMAKNEHPDWPEGKLIEYVYEYQRRNLLYDDAHLQRVFQQTVEDIERVYGIFALTTEENNFLMWSHYSNCHRGFCIGFNTRILWNITAGGIGPVTYQRELPTFSLFEETMMFSHKLLSTKSDIWQYENEFRIIKSGFARKAIKIPPETIEKIILGCNMDSKEKFKIIEYVKANLTSCTIYDTSLNHHEFKVDTTRIY
jgi:hypothetical protein